MKRFMNIRMTAWILVLGISAQGFGAAETHNLDLGLLNQRPSLQPPTLPNGVTQYDSILADIKAAVANKELELTTKLTTVGGEQVEAKIKKDALEKIQEATEGSKKLRAEINSRCEPGDASAARLGEVMDQFHTTLHSALFVKPGVDTKPVTPAVEEKALLLSAQQIRNILRQRTTLLEVDAKKFGGFASEREKTIWQGISETIASFVGATPTVDERVDAFEKANPGDLEIQKTVGNLLGMTDRRDQVCSLDARPKTDEPKKFAAERRMETPAPDAQKLAEERAAAAEKALAEKIAADKLAAEKAAAEAKRPVKPELNFEPFFQRMMQQQAEARKALEEKFQKGLELFKQEQDKLAADQAKREEQARAEAAKAKEKENAQKLEELRKMAKEDQNANKQQPPAPAVAASPGGGGGNPMGGQPQQQPMQDPNMGQQQPQQDPSMWQRMMAMMGMNQNPTPPAPTIIQQSPSRFADIYSGPNRFSDRIPQLPNPQQGGQMYQQELLNALRQQQGQMGYGAPNAYGPAQGAGVGPMQNRFLSQTSRGRSGSSISRFDAISGGDKLAVNPKGAAKTVPIDLQRGGSGSGQLVF